MLDKKTRIKLRSLAMNIKATVLVGKDGFTENVLKQIEEELFNHELIKIGLQDSAPTLNEFELTEMAVKLGADVVTTIGKKIILYKHSEKKNIKHIIAWYCACTDLLKLIWHSEKKNIKHVLNWYYNMKNNINH